MIVGFAEWSQVPEMHGRSEAIEKLVDWLDKTDQRKGILP